MALHARCARTTRPCAPTTRRPRAEQEQMPCHPPRTPLSRPGSHAPRPRRATVSSGGKTCSGSAVAAAPLLSRQSRAGPMLFFSWDEGYYPPEGVVCLLRVSRRCPGRPAYPAGGAPMADDEPRPDRRAEDQYALLLDAAPDAMIVVSTAGTIRLANAQAEKLFGYPRDELLGRSLDFLIPERFRRSHGDHVRRYAAHPSSRSMGSGLELSGRRRDGVDIPVEVSLSPVKWGEEMSICAAIRDITERRRMEASARLSGDRLSSAVETIEDAFALFDSSDRLVLCNSVYRGLFAGLDGPLVGKGYGELLDVWMRDLVFAGDDERNGFRAARLADRRDPKGAFDVRTLDGRNLRVMDRR